MYNRLVQDGAGCKGQGSEAPVRSPSAILNQSISKFYPPNTALILISADNFPLSLLPLHISFYCHLDLQPVDFTYSGTAAAPPMWNAYKCLLVIDKSLGEVETLLHVV